MAPARHAARSMATRRWGRLGDVLASSTLCVQCGPVKGTAGGAASCRARAHTARQAWWLTSPPDTVGGDAADRSRCDCGQLVGDEPLATGKCVVCARGSCIAHGRAINRGIIRARLAGSFTVSHYERLVVRDQVARARTRDPFPRATAEASTTTSCGRSSWYGHRTRRSETG